MPGHDPHPDPFAERGPLLAPLTYRLLGARVRFHSSSAKLLRLVEWAYSDLPEHTLSARAPQLDIHLALNDASTRSRTRNEPAALAFMGGFGLLGCVSGQGSFVALSPDQGSALVTVSRDWLRHPYHVRYELIEFAVFTLAARAQQLLPLHAACVSLRNRGVLLMGASGAGKSTMALQCLLQHFDFVAEDAVFVSAKNMLTTGVPNFLHVCAGTLRWLSGQAAGVIGGSPTIRRRSGVTKFEVDLRLDAYRLAPRPPRLAAVVFLSDRPAGRTLLRPLSAVDVRRRLAAEQPYAAAQPYWQAFAGRMEELGGYELRRGQHPQEGAEALRRLLAAGA